MQDGLAVSRALGDLHLREAGLISTPELSAWQRLNRTQDSFLLLVSDGATEVLSAAQICQIAAATASGTLFDLPQLKSHYVRRLSPRQLPCPGVRRCSKRPLCSACFLLPCEVRPEALSVRKCIRL